MEQIPNNEQAERRAWLVANLKERGADDPEAKAMLTAWLEAEQNKRNPDYADSVLGNTEDHGSGIPATIELGILQKEAGFPVEAKETLLAALEDAYNMGGQEELEIKIEGVLDSLVG